MRDDQRLERFAEPTHDQEYAGHPDRELALDPETAKLLIEAAKGLVTRGKPGPQTRVREAHQELMKRLRSGAAYQEHAEGDREQQTNRDGKTGEQRRFSAHGIKLARSQDAHAAGDVH